MRFHLSLIIVALVLVSAEQARAWDGPRLWYDAAHGATPGGGGIVGTGGRSDFSIHCGHCHVEAKGQIGAEVSFDPPLPTIGNEKSYEPGQSYLVTVSITGEYLGMSGCGEYGMNNNGFAATFENADGEVVGRFSTDSGYGSDACAAEIPPAQDLSGTVITWKDCKAVIPVAMENLTSWSFTWTAPAAGTGSVSMHYAVTDGDCMMDSFNDDTVVASQLLGEATAMRQPAPDSRLAMALALSPLLLLGPALARRQSRNQNRRL